MYIPRQGTDDGTLFCFMHEKSLNSSIALHRLKSSTQKWSRTKTKAKRVIIIYACGCVSVFSFVYSFVCV